MIGYFEGGRLNLIGKRSWSLGSVHSDDFDNYTCIICARVQDIHIHLKKCKIKNYDTGSLHPLIYISTKQSIIRHLFKKLKVIFS